MKRKGFTLIELLAVIIILGILMIIAIPSVTSYINNSRKNSYISTANELIKGAVAFVNSGELDIFDTDTTYYIETSMIPLENGNAKSPFGEFDPAYIVVTYDGVGYSYYFTGRDETGQGVRDIVKSDLLSVDDIVTGIAKDEIKPNIGIGTRSKIRVIKADGSSYDGTAEYNVEENGGARRTSANEQEEEETEIIPDNIVCKRAKKLHDNQAKCYFETYDYNTGIEYDTPKYVCEEQYGNKNVTNGVLKVGDAFDCDVNHDKHFDPETERFYYFSNYFDTETGGFNDEIASFIYYNNTGTGKRGIWSYNHEIYYAYIFLPESTVWKHPNLILPQGRYITDSEGARTWYSTSLTDGFWVENGYYESHDMNDPFISSSRLPHYLEVYNACDNYDFENKCPFLLENVNEKLDGYWMENNDYYIVSHDGHLTGPDYTYSYYTGYDYLDYSYRPVIDVLKTNVLY